MNLLLLLALLIASAYLGGMYLLGRRGKIGLYTVGIEFLLLGAILGSEMIVSIPKDVFKDLFPFVHVELGWIGLLYGIQFEWRRLKRRPTIDWWLMSSEALLTMIAVFLASWLMITRWCNFDGDAILPAAIILAAAASLSSPWAVEAIYRVLKIRTPQIHKLRFIAALDDIPGIIVFSAVFFYLQTPTGLMHSCVSSAVH
ncbi:hypothetical protein K9N50_12345 [bacterium]|nr:hypothetical protein [bacterium]